MLCLQRLLTYISLVLQGVPPQQALAEADAAVINLQVGLKCQAFSTAPCSALQDKCTPAPVAAKGLSQGLGPVRSAQPSLLTVPADIAPAVPALAPGSAAWHAAASAPASGLIATAYRKAINDGLSAAALAPPLSSTMDPSVPAPMLAPAPGMPAAPANGPAALEALAVAIEALPSSVLQELPSSIVLQRSSAGRRML